MWVWAHCGLFCCGKYNNPTNKAQRGGKMVPLMTFICGAASEERGNEIMLCGCKRTGLIKEQAMARGEYQSLISRLGWAYGNKREFIQCNGS